MRSRLIRGRTFILAGSFVLLLIWLVGGNRNPQPVGAFRLSDGTPTIVRAVTFGRGEHAFIQGRYYHQWLSWLPHPVLERFGARIHTYHVNPLGKDPEKVVIWGETQPPAQDPFSKLRFSLLDEHGCEFPYSGGQFGPRATDRLRTSSFTVPRSGSRMRLRLYDPQGNVARPAGELNLPNPARSMAQPGSPEALPVTRNLGNIDCTLSGLEFGDPSVDRLGFPKPRVLRAKLRVTRKGTPTSEYRIQEVHLADGRGNEDSWGRQERAYRSGKDGVLLARGDYRLCQRERSLQLTVRLERNDVDADPLVRIFLPARPAPQVLNQTVGSGPDLVRFTRVSPGSKPGNWRLEAEGSAAGFLPYSIEDARDEAGRSIQEEGSGGTTGASPAQYWVDLAGSPKARELRLRLTPRTPTPRPFLEARFTVALPPVAEADGAPSPGE